MDIQVQVGDKVTIDCMGAVKTIIITTEQQIEQMKENVATYTNKILKIERPVYEVVEEKKELLTEKEREFLKLLNKFRKDGINIIEKARNDDKIFLIVEGFSGLSSNFIPIQRFEGLEFDKRYTLKDLGLEEK